MPRTPRPTATRSGCVNAKRSSERAQRRARVPWTVASRSTRLGSAGMGIPVGSDRRAWPVSWLVDPGRPALVPAFPGARPGGCPAAAAPLPEERTLHSQWRHRVGLSPTSRAPRPQRTNCAAHPKRSERARRAAPLRRACAPDIARGRGPGRADRRAPRRPRGRARPSRKPARCALPTRRRDRRAA